MFCVHISVVCQISMQDHAVCYRTKGLSGSSHCWDSMLPDVDTAPVSRSLTQSQTKRQVATQNFLLYQDVH